MIVLSHMNAGYPGKPVLRKLSLTFPDTGVVALMAPSGYGKTTLLRILAGLLPADSGTISGIEGKKIAFLFQEDRLLPWLTAEKNVEIVSDSAMAKRWLKAMEIEDVGQYPYEMSGGMRRRVALARALAFGGDILLLDEPFKGLDEALKERVASKIRQAAPLIILSVHDREEAELMGADVVQLDQMQK
ncbi:MAG: ABC transporter ATP-binding protein [Clostridia bacterium]|nr:ABC transporter ATP-binding protein [Clostridia bacterium]